MGLFSDKVPTAKFDKIGDSVTGSIVGFEKQQRTEYIRDPKGGRGTAGRPMYWVSGRPTPGVATDPMTGEPNQPVMDQVVVLDTGVKDQFGETQRRLFIKSKQMLTGIREACTDAGVRDVEEGGRLTCTWVSGAGVTGDARVYAFAYAPPADGASAPSAPAAPANPAPAQRTTSDRLFGQPVGVGSMDPPF